MPNPSIWAFRHNLLLFTRSITDITHQALYTEHVERTKRFIPPEKSSQAKAE
jgi:hypothetical protein